METQQQTNTTPPNSKPFLAQVEEFFDTYLHKKAPFHLPANFKETLVKISPWVSLILALLALPVILGVFGMGMALNSYFYAARAYISPTYYVSVGISVITLVMWIMAFAPLQKRSMAGWKLMYHAELLTFVGSILRMDIIGGIIGLVIGMYLLFQIRELYK